MVDLTGQILNDVYIKSRADAPGPGLAKWNCECLVCGKEFVATGANLRKKKAKSCGCLKSERMRKQRFHDLAGQTFFYVEVKEFVGYVKRRPVWKCLCNVCGKEFTATGHGLLAGDYHSCGCLKSYPEKYIADILDKYHIQYQKQKTFIGCKNRAKFRFDIYLTDFNIAIEYDGEMHYKETTLGNDLATQQKYDAIKTKYCEENDIILLRIPYWDKDNIESILKEWLFLDDE